MGRLRCSLHRQVRNIIGSQGPFVPLPWQGEWERSSGALADASGSRTLVSPVVLTSTEMLRLREDTRCLTPTQPPDRLLHVKVAFGEVRGKNDALANSFQISSYPRLVFFCGGDAGVSFPYEVRFNLHQTVTVEDYRFCMPLSTNEPDRVASRRDGDFGMAYRLGIYSKHILVFALSCLLRRVMLYLSPPLHGASVLFSVYSFASPRQFTRFLTFLIRCVLCFRCGPTH